MQTRRHVTSECPSCGRVPHSDLSPAISSMWQELNPVAKVVSRGMETTGISIYPVMTSSAFPHSEDPGASLISLTSTYPSHTLPPFLL